MVAAWYNAGAAQVTRDVPHSLLLVTLLLMAALAVAAIIIIWVGRWIKRAPVEKGDDLAYYRLLYEQGEFSREEYEKIRAKLGVRLRKQLDLPTPGAEPSAPPPDSKPQPDTDIRVGRPLPPAPPPEEPPPV